MIGWIVSAFLLVGWFSTVVYIGFKLIQVKEIIIQLSEKAGADTEWILK